MAAPAWRSGATPLARHLPDLFPAAASLAAACLAGQPVLLPLTESLYVSGTLESVDTVLLEIGTGYFVEVAATGRAAMVDASL